MAVRVPLRLRGEDGSEVETVAVLNGGFEVSVPHLLLPARCAEALFPDYRQHSVARQYQAAGGTPLPLLRLTRTVATCVIAGRREGPSTRLHVLVSETEREALVSDSGIDALRIHIESFSPGRWRLRGEKRRRPSARPQYW